MHRSVNSVLVLACALLGCASGSESEPAQSVSAPAPSTDTTGGEQGPADGARVDELLGFWAEYWSVGGEAKTQRYVFLPDGRFGWLAAPDDPGQVLRRNGRWALEEDVLVLSQTSRLERGCKVVPCASEPVRIAEPTPVELRLELGDCPDNAEARALDNHYVCLSLDGRAFWRLAGSDGDDPAPFFK